MNIQNKINRTIIYKRIASVLLISATFLCANESSLSSQIPEIRPGILQGYLDVKTLPNSLNLMPEAPVQGSAAQHLDNAVSQKYFGLQGTPRWEMATKDADLNKDGKIMVSELRDYLMDNVSKLTRGNQNPTCRRLNLEFDFRIW